ncbi:OLC1v1034103C1 [Oldenlandia corymbosa var. corymbosa]|uniref:OLC1v1034103C1 n=1 Tax=Oldenlandia corymbosa var. corymbosa TaxID=529605 RepID=A0AAV1CPY5_OLDCO|nr:OLC1v1034103C1 [Oldenlandia corymbosa var. corymbosa]
MDDGAATPLPTTTTQTRLLRCRSNSYSKSVLSLSFKNHRPSIATPSPFSSWSSGVDFDPVLIKPSSYTSLKDLLPSTAVNSPKPNSPTQSASKNISIKNHLVKQAAFAYLQPMSSTPDATGRNFFRRIWIKLQANNPVGALRNFFNVHVFGRLNHAFDWLLQTVCLRSSR